MTAKLNYRVKKSESGIRLSIWEDAPLTDTRTKPFTFKANYRLTTQEEVLNILDLLGISPLSVLNKTTEAA